MSRELTSAQSYVNFRTSFNLRVQLEVAEKEISQLKKTLKNKNERYEKNLLELTKEIQRNSSVRKENKIGSTSSPPRQTLKNTTGSVLSDLSFHTISG